jgi:hypothetical protein
MPIGEKKRFGLGLSSTGESLKAAHLAPVFSGGPFPFERGRYSFSAFPSLCRPVAGKQEDAGARAIFSLDCCMREIFRSQLC